MEEMTLTQIAEYLNVSKKKLHEIIQNGDFADSIPQIFPKKWKKSDIDEWKNNNKNILI